MSSASRTFPESCQTDSAPCPLPPPLPSAYAARPCPSGLGRASRRDPASRKRLPAPARDALAPAAPGPGGWDPSKQPHAPFGVWDHGAAAVRPCGCARSVAACARRVRASHPHRSPLSSCTRVFNFLERPGLFERQEQGSAPLLPLSPSPQRPLCPCPLPLPLSGSLAGAGDAPQSGGDESAAGGLWPPHAFAKEEGRQGAR